MFAQFDDSLITGNEMIDSQHKELIGRINNLLKCCNEPTGTLNAVSMLNYLADYTNYHFAEEEKLQEELEYPGMKEHKEKHIEFKKAIEDLHQMLEEEEGPSEAFVKAVESNIRDWFYSHITRYDRSVAEYKYIRMNPDML